MEVEEEKGHVQLQNVEYEDKLTKDEELFTKVQNEKVEQLMAELDAAKKSLIEASENLANKTSACEELSRVIDESKVKEAMFQKEKTFFDQTYKELVDTNENLKANLAEVEGYLLREREEKVSFQIKMAQIDEEKESLEEKCKELQQALDEFYWTTDKGKGTAAMEDGTQDEG